MTLFTIETTYRLPVYRHRTYEAETFAEACRLAIEDDDWTHERHDFDSAGENYISGAWEGRDNAYRAPAVPVPSHYQETAQRQVEHFTVLLDVVKGLIGAPHPDEPQLWRDQAVAAIAKAEVILAGARDPD